MHSKYDLEDIFKNCITIQNQNQDKAISDNIIKMLCNVDDYMKSVFCVGMAIEMLKENGLKVEINLVSNEEQSLGAYFYKNKNRIVITANQDDEKTYLVLLNQFVYKWLDMIKLDNEEIKILCDTLDSVRENAKLFYEELTQNEIKMLECIDEKVIELVNNINNSDVCQTSIDFIDKNVADLIGVYMMWGRSLERLELVSHILNPLLDYVDNNILTKFEHYILDESSKEYLEKINTPDYFKIKLNVIKSLEYKDIKQDKKFDILKEVRMLEIPKKTDKSLKKVRYLFNNYISNSKKIDKLYEGFVKQKSIYEFSIQQRNDELGSIKTKKNELYKDERNNVEIIAQLVNLEGVIKDEKKDLEKSLWVINSQINILKRAGVGMSEDKYELHGKEMDEDLKECAKELLNLKLGNNRWHNLSHDMLNEKQHTKNVSNGINFEYEKFLEEMKKRDFDLSDDFFYRSIEKGASKELGSIRVYEPKVSRSKNIVREGKGIEK